MRPHHAVQNLIAVFLGGMVLNACHTEYVRYVGRTSAPLSSRPAGRLKSLSEIDLSKIGHIAPKGRVQDKEYNDLEVVDNLIRHGEETIPFLIDKLDDETVIQNSVIDYFPRVTIGDVAFLILSDFAVDSTFKKETIPGGSWDNFFGTRHSNASAWEYYDSEIQKHGRAWVKAKWKKIWTTYKDRIVWDEKERCFKVI
jgi:hypothetical protein